MKTTYQCFVEALYNHMVRTHPSGPGKHAVAQDEFLELLNRIFAMFPKVRMLKGMSQSGDCLCPTQRCKRFCQKYYVTKNATVDRVITKRGKNTNQTPERKLIFELLLLLLEQSHPTRTLTNDIIRKMANSGKATTKNKKTRT